MDDRVSTHGRNGRPRTRGARNLRTNGAAPTRPRRRRSGVRSQPRGVEADESGGVAGGEAAAGYTEANRRSPRPERTDHTRRRRRNSAARSSATATGSDSSGPESASERSTDEGDQDRRAEPPVNNVLTRSMVEQWQAVLSNQSALNSRGNRASSSSGSGGAASVGSQGAAAAAAAAAAPVPETSTSPRDSRSLFGRPSEEEMAAFWLANKSRFSSDFRSRWSFDPESSQPDDDGEYVWERVSNAQTPSYTAGQLSNMTLSDQSAS